MTKSKRILLIDDDLISIATISQMLLQGGYHALHVTSRTSAMGAILEEKPDLVICNLDGGQCDAVQLVQSLQQERQARNIPFLFLVESDRSADPAPEILGPRQYLKKPFTREQLVSAVQEHFKRRQQSSNML